MKGKQGRSGKPEESRSDAVGTTRPNPDFTARTTGILSTSSPSSRERQRAAGVLRHICIDVRREIPLARRSGNSSRRLRGDHTQTLSRLEERRGSRGILHTPQYGPAFAVDKSDGVFVRGISDRAGGIGAFHPFNSSVRVFSSATGAPRTNGASEGNDEGALDMSGLFPAWSRVGRKFGWRLTAVANCTRSCHAEESAATIGG